MRESLETVAWRAKARKYGAMEGSTRETSRMERRMVKATSNGLMAINTLDLGSRASNTVSVYGHLLQKMVG